MVSLDTVKHVAALAKLDLTDKELALMQAQLSKILGYVDLIKSLDTTKVLPTHHIHKDSVNVFQTVKNTDFNVDTYFKHRVNKEGRYITTKKVLNY